MKKKSRSKESQRRCREVSQEEGTEVSQKGSITGVAKAARYRSEVSQQT